MLRLKLIPSKDFFNLMADDANIGYKSVMTYVVPLIHKAKLNPVVSVAHKRVLLQANVKYSLKE